MNRHTAGLTRRIFHWVVWDRKNIVMVVAAFFTGLFLFTAYSMIAPYLNYDPATAATPPQSASPVPSQSESSSAAPVPSWMPSLPPSPSPSSNIAAVEEERHAAVREAASAFISAWLNAHVVGDQVAWASSVKKHTTGGQVDALIDATPIGVIPRAMVVKAEVEMSTMFTADAIVTITNGETLHVALVNNGGWKVQMYGPGEAE